jgi:hypothetical protein
MNEQRSEYLELFHSKLKIHLFILIFLSFNIRCFNDDVMINYKVWFIIIEDQSQIMSIAESYLIVKNDVI